MPKTDGLRKFLVTGLGTGWLPVAPGSWGSLLAGGLFLLVAWGSGMHPVWTTAAMVVVAVAASVGCVALGPFAEAAYARKDPGEVTLDEVAGQALTYALLPLGAGWRGLLVVAAAGFVAFRLFDIIKPPPVRASERLPGGWGILTDDLIAAVYANVACQLLLRLWLLA